MPISKELEIEAVSVRVPVERFWLLATAMFRTVEPVLFWLSLVKELNVIVWLDAFVPCRPTPAIAAWPFITDMLVLTDVPEPTLLLFELAITGVKIEPTHE
jgi:hypothetical protein